MRTYKVRIYVIRCVDHVRIHTNFYIVPIILEYSILYINTLNPTVYRPPLTRGGRSGRKVYGYTLRVRNLVILQFAE